MVRYTEMDGPDAVNAILDELRGMVAWCEMFMQDVAQDPSSDMTEMANDVRAARYALLQADGIIDRHRSL